MCIVSMKKKLVSIVMSVWMFHALGQTNPALPFSVEVQISNAGKDTLELLYTDDDGKSVQLAQVSINNTAQFEGKITFDRPAFLRLKKAGVKPTSTPGPNGLRFFIAPGQTKIVGKADSLNYANVRGSKSQKEYQEFKNIREPLMNRLNELRNSYKITKDSAQRAKIDLSIEKIRSAMDASDSLFFENHRNSYVTAYILVVERIPGIKTSSLQNYYSRLGADVQRSNYAVRIKGFLDKITAASPGSPAPLFSGNDLKNSLLRLDDYRGKYLLLDFWATWCVPCREESPELIQLYDRYHEKGFEIVGIADDDKRQELWKAAIKQDNTGRWRHLLSGRENIAPNERENLIDKYSVMQLPTKILIDPKGIIVGRYDFVNGTLTDLKQKLAAIFQ